MSILLNSSQFINYSDIFVNNGLFGSCQFSSSTSTSILGFKYYYGCTDTSSILTLTISSSDILRGSLNKYWFFIIKDESGLAGTNNITIETEGSETIDGSSNYIISNNYGSVSLASNGSNLFII